MPRKPSSQWEFGELFPTPPDEPAAPVPASRRTKPPATPDAEAPEAPEATRAKSAPPASPGSGPGIERPRPAAAPEPVRRPAAAGIDLHRATSTRRAGRPEPAAPDEGTPGSDASTDQRRVLTITEITGSIRRLLEREIGEVWVTGEVTNMRLQSSGHAYFTLKDANAQLSCVLFRGAASGARREYLADGQKLLVSGALSVYEPRGQYQLIVKSLEPQGVGALQIAFEKLKRKLQAEGLFASERKRPLPRYPQRLGLVTSPTGAAIRDVLHVIERRQPGLDVVLAPCRVQGDGAAAEIAAAIRLLNEWNLTLPAGERLDLILVTRGGGSLEDLWAFNEEIVARAIFESTLPVVSAVGHEIDFTIADFVADVRAATPSAAAEILTEGAFASRQFVARAGQRLAQLARGRLELCRNEAETLARRLERVHPRRRLEEHLQRLDELQLALHRRARQALRERVTTWTHLRQRLLQAKPSALLRLRREAVDALAQRLGLGVRRQWRDLQSRLDSASARLRLLSPESVLARGYSVTLDAVTGQVVRDARALEAGRRLRTRLQSGEVTSVVEPVPPRAD